MLSRKNLLAALRLGLAAVLYCFAALASAVPAGSAEFVTGPVTVLNAAGERGLRKGDPIEVGDLVRTGGGRAQLRFTDGGFVSLQPQTQFRVDEYHFNGKADGSEKGVFSFLTGALRTITGLIGKSNRDAYQVKTAVATIGIRGTGYTGESDGKSLKAAVFDGRIVLRNKGGELEVGSGQAAFVRDPETRPELSFDRPRAGPVSAQRLAALVRPNGAASAGDAESVATRFAEAERILPSGIPGALAKPIADRLGVSENELIRKTADQIGALLRSGEVIDDDGQNTTPGTDVTGNYLIYARANSPLDSTTPNVTTTDNNCSPPCVSHAVSSHNEIVTASDVTAKFANIDPKRALQFVYPDLWDKITRNIGTARNRGNGRDGIIAWGQWAEGKTFFTCAGCHVQTELLANNGIDYVVGVPTVTMPIGKATYILLGAPAPVANSHAPAWGGGEVTRAELIANFDRGRIDFHADLSFPNMPEGPGHYHMNARDVAFAGNTFSAFGNFTTASGGAAGDCVGGCATDLKGFFAGEPTATAPGASRAGIAYLFASQLAQYFDGRGSNHVGGSMALRMVDYNPSIGNVAVAVTSSVAPTPNAWFPSRVYVNPLQDNALTGIDLLTPTGEVAQSVAIGSARAGDMQRDQYIGWGRWFDGVAVGPNGVPLDLRGANAAAHAVVALVPTVTLPTGTATYDFKGATTPSVRIGGGGAAAAPSATGDTRFDGATVAGGILTADFDQARIGLSDMRLNLPNGAGPGQAGSYTLAADNLTIAKVNGAYGFSGIGLATPSASIAGSCSVSCPTSIAGVLAGDQAQRAGFAYNLQRLDNIQIQGVAVFAKR